MRVLFISHLWPRKGAIYLAAWVPEQIAALAAKCEVSIVAPVDRTIRREEVNFSGLFSGFRGYRERAYPELMTLKDIPIETRPYYGIIPRKIFAKTTAKNLEKALSNVSLDGIDLVHVHTLFPDGIACARWMADKKIPLVATTHSNDVPADLGVLKEAMREFFRRVDALIIVCRKQGEQLEAIGADPERIHFIPNGFLAATYQNIDDSERNSRRIAYLGRLHPVKRVDLLIKALAECPSDITLEIAGDGPEEKKLKFLARNLNLQDRVRFLKAVPREKIPQFLAETALLCIVSDREGWPTVINEALACGTPILSTAVGGVPEALQDPKLGTLIPVDISPGQLSKKIVSCLAINWDRQYIREHAFRFTWEKISTQILDLYRHVLDHYKDR